MDVKPSAWELVIVVPRREGRERVLERGFKEDESEDFVVEGGSGERDGCLREEGEEEEEEEEGESHWKVVVEEELEIEG